MEILIYLIIPCVGSVFLLGGMFYGAYRMSGDTDMPRQESLLRGKGVSRRKDMTRRKIGIIAAYILVCIAFSSLGNTWVNLFFQLLFPLVAWRVYGTPKIYCLYYLILSVAVWLTDVAAVLTFQILTAEGILYLNAPQLQYILLVAVTRMTEFMVILLVSMVVGHKAGRHITVRQVALSVLLPLYSVFNMYCMLYLIQIFPTKEMLVLLGINLALLIGLNIYFCVLVDIMSENHRLENERNLYRAQARMQHQYYEQEEEKYEASRKLIHDIRNHIQAMEALYARGTCPEGCQGKGREGVRRDIREEVEGEAREGIRRDFREEAREGIRRDFREEAQGEAREGIRKDLREEAREGIRRDFREEAQRGIQGEARRDIQKEARESVQGNVGESVRREAREDIQRAEKYAGDIHRMLNSLQQKYYTSEKLLNIILNDKARTMKRLGVKEDMKVGELSLDFMKETDVTALFANLLDNAVAAAAESRDGYVRLRVNRVRQFLSVTVENSCDMAPVKSGSAFRSHKAGHEGLGLKIIRQTVEQYGGDVQMGWKEGVFTVRVMLAAEDSG